MEMMKKERVTGTEGLVWYPKRDMEHYSNEFSGESELFFLTCAVLSGLSPGSVVCFEDLFLLDRRMNEQTN